MPLPQTERRKEMKELFDAPDIEVIVVVTDDIIMTSSQADEDEGIELPDFPIT